MAKKKAESELKKLQLNLINAKGLVDFLGKFKVIDTNILISITPEIIEVRTVTPTDSAFKEGTINFEDVFVLPEGETMPDELKIGIFNVDKFTKIFSYIDEDNIALNITYKQEDGYSLKTEIRTATLQKTFPSAGKNSFRTMTDDQVETAFNVDEATFKIGFDKNLLDRINNLLSLETSKFFNLIYKKGVLTFTGKEFKLKYTGEIEVITDGDLEIPFEKTAFKYADKEDYELYAKETGVLLFGKNSEFKTGLCAADGTDEGIPSETDPNAE